MGYMDSVNNVKSVHNVRKVHNNVNSAHDVHNIQVCPRAHDGNNGITAGSAGGVATVACNLLT